MKIVICATQNAFNAVFLFGFSSDFRKTTKKRFFFYTHAIYVILHKQWKTNLCVTKDLFFMMCYIHNSHISWYEWRYRIFFGFFFIARVSCKHAVPKSLDRLLQIRLGKKILNVTNRKKKTYPYILFVYCIIWCYFNGLCWKVGLKAFQARFVFTWNRKQKQHAILTTKMVHTKFIINSIYFNFI